MKTDFYYKEEFPLEMRVTIHSLAELAVFNAMFTIAAQGVQYWTAYMATVCRDKDGAKLVENSSISLTKEFLEAHEYIKEVYEQKRDDRRNVLQGGMAEGTENTNSE